MTPNSKISLDAAKPGMILAEDVRRGEQVLLPRGSELSTAQIEGLRRCEIEEIVVSPPAERSAAEIEALQSAEKERVARLFRRAGSDSTMQALLRTVLEYRLENRP